MTTRQFVQQGGTESWVLAPSLSGGDVYDDVDDDDDVDEVDGFDFVMVGMRRRSEEVARGRGCTHTYAIVTGITQLFPFLLELVRNSY